MGIIINGNFFLISKIGPTFIRLLLAFTKRAFPTWSLPFRNGYQCLSVKQSTLCTNDICNTFFFNLELSVIVSKATSPCVYELLHGTRLKMKCFNPMLILKLLNVWVTTKIQLYWLLPKRREMHVKLFQRKKKVYTKMRKFEPITEVEVWLAYFLPQHSD